MKIGIISDTHDQINNIKKAIKVFKKEIENDKKESRTIVYIDNKWIITTPDFLKEREIFSTLIPKYE